jgi:hypothetical protein
MKRNLTLSLLAIASFSFAQITIDSTDFGIPGDTIKLKEAIGLNYTMTGTGGANQLWDYSNLPYQSEDTISVVTSANSPWPASTQFSNIALEQDDFYSYFNMTANVAELIGLSGDIFNLGTPLEVPYMNGVTQMKFPADYLDLDADTGNFILEGTPTNFGLSGLPFQVDSIRVVSQTVVNDDYDAYGELILVTDTHTCLRRWRTELRTDSLFMIAGILGPGWNLIPAAFLAAFPAPYNSSNPALIESNKYEWFTKAEDYPVLTIFTTDNTGATGHRAAFQWDSTLNPVSVRSIFDNEDILIYPNPSSGELFFNAELINSKRVKILNASGQIVAQKGFSTYKGQMKRIDLSDLGSGVYFIEVERSTGSELIKFVIR